MYCREQWNFFLSFTQPFPNAHILHIARPDDKMGILNSCIKVRYLLTGFSTDHGQIIEWCLLGLMWAPHDQGPSLKKDGFLLDNILFFCLEAQKIDDRLTDSCQILHSRPFHQWSQTEYYKLIIILIFGKNTFLTLSVLCARIRIRAGHFRVYLWIEAAPRSIILFKFFKSDQY